MSTTNIAQEEAAAAVAVTLVVGCDKVKREIEDAVLDQLRALQYGDNVTFEQRDTYEDYEDGCARCGGFLFELNPKSISSPCGTWTALHNGRCEFQSKDLHMDLFGDRPAEASALRLEFFRFRPGYDYIWDEECKNLERIRPDDVFAGELSFFSGPVHCQNMCNQPMQGDKRVVLSFRTRGHPLVPYAPNRIHKMELSICDEETFNKVRERGGMMSFQPKAARPFNLIL